MFLLVVLHPHNLLEKHVTATPAPARLLDVQLGFIFVLLLTSWNSAGSSTERSRPRGLSGWDVGVVIKCSDRWCVYADWQTREDV
jgi:hypothetical protein